MIHARETNRVEALMAEQWRFANSKTRCEGVALSSPRTRLTRRVCEGGTYKYLNNTASSQYIHFSETESFEKRGWRNAQIIGNFFWAIGVQR